MNLTQLVPLLQARLPGLLSVHAFGSRVQGTAGPSSDLDLAVLVEGYADPVVLFDLSGKLADLAGCPVDLLDLRAASSVMQQQVLMLGDRLWARDPEAGLTEAAMLTEKLHFDASRAALLDDITQRGSVHDR